MSNLEKLNIKDILDKDLMASKQVAQEMTDAIGIVINHIRDFKSAVESDIGNIDTRVRTADINIRTILDSKVQSIKDDIEKMKRDPSRDRFMKLYTDLAADVDYLRSIIPEKEYFPIEEIQIGITKVNDRVQRLEQALLEETRKLNDIIDERIIEAFRKYIPPTRQVGPGPRGVDTFINEVNKGLLQTFDFKAGSNMTIGYSEVGGIPTLTFASSGGSGFSELTATGSVNSVNAAFTFTQKPSYIVRDGVWMKENKGWTWNSGSLTATMSVPPDTDIYGVA